MVKTNLFWNFLASMVGIWSGVSSWVFSNNGSAKVSSKFGNSACCSLLFWSPFLVGERSGVAPEAPKWLKNSGKWITLYLTTFGYQKNSTLKVPKHSTNKTPFGESDLSSAGACCDSSTWITADAPDATGSRDLAPLPASSA